MSNKILRDYTWNILVNILFKDKDIVQTLMKINENRMSALIGDFYKINNNDNNKIL